MDLAEENERLKKVIEEKEQDVILAGKYGLDLLENNTALTNQIDDLTKQYTTTIKELQQENYSLTQKLEVQLKIEKSQSSEVELLVKEMAALKSNADDQSNQQLNDQKACEQLQKRVEDLEKDIEKLQLQNACLTDELKVKQNHVNELKAAVSVKSTSSSDDKMLDELQDLQSRYELLLTEKQDLDSCLGSLKSENEKLKLNFEHEMNNRLQVEQELEQKECQISSYTNAIERARQEKLELQVEMDAMKMDECDPNSRGNSLFAEVEDKRARLQNQMINLRVSHDTLEKRNKIYLNQISKLKHQMIGLLSMSGNKVDSEYVRQLNNSLTQSRAEVQELMAKVVRLQSSCQDQKVSPVKCKQSEEISDDDVNGFVKFMLNKSRKECEDLKKEVQSIRFAKTAETDAYLECQRKLYASELECNKYKSEVLQLRMKIDEVTANKETSKPTVSQRTEKIPGFESFKSSEMPTNQTEILKDITDEVRPCNKIEEVHIPDKESLKKTNKKSVRIDVDENVDVKVTEKQEIVSKRKGYAANVVPKHYKDATMQCPQQ